VLHPYTELIELVIYSQFCSGYSVRHSFWSYFIMIYYYFKHGYDNPIAPKQQRLGFYKYIFRRWYSVAINVPGKPSFRLVLTQVSCAISPRQVFKRRKKSGPAQLLSFDPSRHLSGLDMSMLLSLYCPGIACNATS
jgi:hypothetical protein